jgi:hypothetical protein
MHPRRRSPFPFRPLALSLIVVVLLAAACGDDDVADDPSPDATTGADEATDDDEGATDGRTDDGADDEGAAGAYTGYDDHESDQYAGTDNWICHPELDDDVCSDLSTTVVEPDGTERVEEAVPADDTSVDCFYVYPTTSADEGPASDLDFDESESDTVRAQVARFGSVCRVFAPVHRQITIGGLFSGEATPELREQAYEDVFDAWRTYVNDHNDGRGVVLIGHSQGVGYLRTLISDEIDPDPELRPLLVSALLLGSAVSVPDGEDVGGDFQEVPVCASADDTGCVISFASFRSDSDPGAAESRFGRSQEEGQRAVCVDPTALLGDEGGPASAVVPTQVSLLGGAVDADRYDTPFVSYPDAVRTSCVRAGDHDYLAVEAADPDDPRDLEPFLTETLGPDWGLHLIDANVAQDDLIEIVERQAAAHRS